MASDTIAAVEHQPLPLDEPYWLAEQLRRLGVEPEA